jgi:hypothetical protein
MTVEEYFNQGEWYYSESQHDQVLIESMATPHCANVYSKLMREFPLLFPGSVLAQALLTRMAPTHDDIVASLNRYGVASVWVGTGRPVTIAGARSRLRRAGARRTHIDGQWVRGDMMGEDVVVNVRQRTTT